MPRSWTLPACLLSLGVARAFVPAIRLHSVLSPGLGMRLSAVCPTRFTLPAALWPARFEVPDMRDRMHVFQPFSMVASNGPRASRGSARRGRGDATQFRAGKQAASGQRVSTKRRELEPTGARIPSMGQRLRGGGAGRPKRQARSEVAPAAAQMGTDASKINPNSRTSKTTLSQITSSRFADLDVHPATKRGITEALGYDAMTLVQAQSLPVALTGVDVLAKAKTGTGKTLAFLIPAVEACLKAPAPGKIKALIVSPTRELAQQIADEGEILCKFHNLRLQCVVGGTRISKDINGFKQPPDILVATPGRLNDHLTSSGLQKLLSQLRVLVFDEADQLLDMGFRPAITEMLSLLPPKHTRQCLLFSATMPSDVEKVARIAMREQLEFVDTVGKEENTHQHVEQSYVLTTMHSQFAEVVRMVEEGRRTEDYKIMVFFTTARQTQFFAELFDAYGIPALEIHSRLSQSRRNKVSDRFREGSNLVLFSSDVTARGMDYPDVTRVIQVGAPSDRAKYIHRLGRTARAGKDGSGVLLLCDFEQFFLKELSDLPLKPRTPIGAEDGRELQAGIKKALAKLPDETFCAAYQANMGYYNGFLRKMRWSKEDLVRYGNEWVLDACGYKQVPTLQAKTVGKMGLKGVPGLNIEGRSASSGGRAAPGRGRGGAGGGPAGRGGGGAGRGRVDRGGRGAMRDGSRGRGGGLGSKGRGGASGGKAAGRRGERHA